MVDRHEKDIKVMDYLKLSRNASSFILLIAMNLVGSGDAHAQTTSGSASSDRSGVERIDASDRLRMLSQEISAAACLFDAGIDVQSNRGVIEDGIADFDNILSALRDGDPAFGIALPETNRKMLAAIRGLSLQWDRLKLAAGNRVGGIPDDSLVDYLSRQNINTMHAAKYLVTEAVNTYAVPPALLQGDAFTINILARQRTLAHQMSKELCGVASGNLTMGNVARLRNSVRLFDASLVALRDGFPAAGVAAPPSDETLKALEAMAVEWNTISEQIERVASQQDMSQATKLMARLGQLQDALDSLVTTYAQDSKSGI